MTSPTDRIPRPSPVASGVRTTPAPSCDVTRIVLVRHGEATCNVEGVVGGRRGCTGLTAAGREQVAAVGRWLAATGELGPVGALYASPLPRAVETAEILAPALDRWRDGPPLELRTDCALCELHPGEADGLTWQQFTQRFDEPDWDADPTVVIAPGGESWTSFVERAAGALSALARVHEGGTVVVASHAGVVEASILRLLPVDRSVARLGLRTLHGSLTVWERTGTRWTLERYNDHHAADGR